MAEVKTDYGSGGSQLAPEGAGDPGLATVLRDQADDFETLRTKFNALLAQLDLEGGLGGGYVAAHAIASGDIKHQKG
jgi:hypothetical protein